MGITRDHIVDVNNMVKPHHSRFTEFFSLNRFVDANKTIETWQRASYQGILDSCRRQRK